MSTANESQNKQLTPLNRSQIARVIFAAAESMGISNRQQIEMLTRQVIERLEQTQSIAEMETVGQPQPLPGMEHLMPKSHHRQKQLATESEILALVKEFLDAGELAQTEEVKPEMQTITTAKPKAPPITGINLTENALRVLEKRYLEKDKQGQVIETPEEMFRRVAQAIASAELIYDSKADVKTRAWWGSIRNCDGTTCKPRAGNLPAMKQAETGLQIAVSHLPTDLRNGPLQPPQPISASLRNSFLLLHE